MNKVTSINLNGNAYQLEEPGYDALTAYLTQARERLTGNPDQDEIMADLEQAVAEKLKHFLSPHKSVVTAAEVEDAIQEMGPVDGDAPEQTAPTGAKRLYRIKEGSIIGGVAAGLAAYLGMDVLLLRIILVVLTFATSGGLIFGYVLAWIFIPEARTSREQAEAKGIPFTTEELLGRAKTEYSKLDGKHAEWKSQWRHWRKNAKQQAREHKAWVRQQKSWEYGQWYPRRRSVFGELFWLLALSFAAWYGYHHVLALHDFMDAVWGLWHRTADQIAEFIVSLDQTT